MPINHHLIFSTLIVQATNRLSYTQKNRNLIHICSPLEDFSSTDNSKWLEFVLTFLCKEQDPLARFHEAATKYIYSNSKLDVFIKGIKDCGDMDKEDFTNLLKEAKLCSTKKLEQKSVDSKVIEGIKDCGVSHLYDDLLKTLCYTIVLP